MLEVFKSVSSGNTCGGIAPHFGKSAPFRGQGKARTPVSAPLQNGLRFFHASSTCTAIPPPLRSGYSGTYALHRQESHTGLPRTAASTDGVRTPLYTGWCYECAGPPSILACLTTIAILALEPNGSSSSASLTIRTTTRLYLHYPYPSFPTAGPACYSPSCALPSAQHPTVASDAPPVREQVTLHHGCISSPSDYNSRIGDSTSQQRRK
jgi:hypothetical protein